MVQDKPFKYTAPCGIWDPGHSFFGQIANNTDSDTSNSDAQGQVNDNGQLHLTKPASLSPSLKRGWGRPRSEEKPKRKRRRAPARIAPKLQVPEESLRESNNQPIPLSGIYSPNINPCVRAVTDTKHQTRSPQLSRNPLKLSWSSQTWNGQLTVRTYFTTKWIYRPPAHPSKPPLLSSRKLTLPSCLERLVFRDSWTY